MFLHTKISCLNELNLENLSEISNICAIGYTVLLDRFNKINVDLTFVCTHRYISMNIVHIYVLFTFIHKSLNVNIRNLVLQFLTHISYHVLSILTLFTKHNCISQNCAKHESSKNNNNNDWLPHNKQRQIKIIKTKTPKYLVLGVIMIISGKLVN